MNQLQDVQQYIQQQKQLLSRALSSYGDIFSKSLGKISKEAYYYPAQVQDDKQLWQHPDQIEAKAMSLLTKSRHSVRL